MISYRDGFLIQIILYSGLWLYDDYVGLIVSLILGCIVLALLVFSIIVEFIEKSKVPKSFYIWMIISIVPPVLVSLFFTILYQGQFSWIDQFG